MLKHIFRGSFLYFHIKIPTPYTSCSSFIGPYKVLQGLTYAKGVCSTNEVLKSGFKNVFSVHKNSFAKMYVILKILALLTSIKVEMF